MKALQQSRKAAPPSRGIRSRRKPHLRLVGGAPDYTRHRFPMLFGAAGYVCEFWTFAEWDKLPAEQRPADPSFIPGLGFMEFRPAISNDEFEDVKDIRRQAQEQWQECE